MLRNLTSAAPFAAWSASASAKTMNGAWPPSSIDTRFMVAAARLASILPISVEPVNVSFRTAVEASMASPTSAGRFEVTRLATPAGMPASARISNIATAHSVVCSAGLRTMVHPVDVQRRAVSHRDFP